MLAASANGFGYGDKERTPSGISRLVVKTGSSTKAMVSGPGPDLGVPNGAGVMLGGRVTVQLRSSTTPVYLSAEFAAPALVDGKGVFKDTTP